MIPTQTISIFSYCMNEQGITNIIYSIQQEPIPQYTQPAVFNIQKLEATK